MSKKSYNQNCSLAFSLDILGERWTLLILRDLFSGPKRFSTLEKDLIGIGPNLLTRRLNDLKSFGIVRKVPSSIHSSLKVWELTKMGLDLEPVLLNLASWGAKYFPHNYDLENHWSPIWNFIASKSRFNSQVSKAYNLVGSFNIDNYKYWVEIKKGQLLIEEGHISKFDFEVKCSADEFKQFLFEDKYKKTFVNQFVNGNKTKFKECINSFN